MRNALRLLAILYKKFAVISISYVRFWVLAHMTTKSNSFCAVTLYNLVEFANIAP